jgi:hypothetical protein
MGGLLIINSIPEGSIIMTTPRKQIAAAAAGAQMSNFFIDYIGTISVKAYGAKGGGIFDDTGPFQAAIDAANVNGNKEVYCPHGTYKVTALTGTSGITFVGDNVTIVGGADIIVTNLAEYSEFKSSIKKAFVNVKLPPAPLVAAVGNGVIDDTVAIQACIDYVWNSGGGTVFCPSGKYKITSLWVHIGVNIQGVSCFDNNFQDGGSSDIYKKGSWFFCTDTVNAALLLQFGSYIKNVSFFYPNQSTNSAPIVYPASIQIIGSFGMDLIEECYFDNSYWAIDASTGLSHSGITIKNCKGTPLKYGITLDGGSDVDRIEDVHFHSHFSYRVGDVLKAWISANAVAFKFGYSDWAMMSNCFAYGYQCGLYCENGASASATNYLSVINCGFDACQTGIYTSGNVHGIKIVNCNITAHSPFDSAAICIAINCTAAGEMTISNTQIWGTTGTAIRLVNGNHVILDNICILDFGSLSSSGNLISAMILSANNYLDIKNCHIDGKDRQYVRGIWLLGGNNWVKIKDSTIKSMGIAGSRQYGLSLDAGSNYVICKDNQLKDTNGVIDGLGDVTKDIVSNMSV